MRIFGKIAGIPEGSEFENRYYLSQYGVHKPLQAGISGSQIEGADSLVLSGGYEDDEDYGDIIIYTGHGGRSQGPNHHVMFDFGGFSIADDLTLLGLSGKLYKQPKHPIDPRYLRYHRTHFTVNDF